MAVGWLGVCWGCAADFRVLKIHILTFLSATAPYMLCRAVSCYVCYAAQKQVNTEIVAIQRVITAAGEAQLKGLIQQHAAKTGSKKAAALLADWDAAKGKFWQIVPPGESVGLVVC